ncbi:MAG: DUF488 domain-containing protein [Candidatus Poribacteria bacterium]|nr:DUF488 domain-containing protein [Candidatus Poribacteria bacterium]
MQKIVTIGAIGFDRDTFLAALKSAHVDTFCDLRARRMVRGSQYAFANSLRLQTLLEENGIRYRHFPDLAPSQETRDAQAAEDADQGIARRQRSSLGDAFINAYRNEILWKFDPHAFLTQIGTDARVVALFCVEREPSACHRSLLAATLENLLKIETHHLVPAVE